MPQDYLTTGEFTRAMTTLSKEMGARFDRVDEMAVDHSARIVALETHSKIRERAQKSSVKKNASGWSAAVSAIVILVAEAVKAYWGK